MAKKKAVAKRKPRVRVVKVIAPDPARRIVELEVIDDPTNLPEPLPPLTEPVDVERHPSLLEWVKSLW